MYRQFTKGNKITLQLPEGFREKVLRLAHETSMTGHLGIKKALDRVVSEFFFGQGFVVMWLGFVNLATFVRELFSKVVSLRYLWEKRVAVDIVGPIEPLNEYILKMIDYAMRY